MKKYSVAPKLFNSFPREVGISFKNRATVESEKQMLRLVNNYNKKTRIGVTVYNYFKKHNELVNVNKVFLDLDGENCLENAKKLHKYLKGNIYKHTMFFSGGGFHFYIRAKNYESLTGKEHKKLVLKNAQVFVAKEAKLKWGTDLDTAPRGNIAQLATFPNTFNVKRNRYCIPVSEEDLELDLDKIKEKAKKQRFENFVYGRKSLDLLEFNETPRLKVNFSANQMKSCPKISMEIIPPCFSEKLKEKEKLGNGDRFKLLIFLRDKGFPKRSALLFLEKHMQPKEFFHMAEEEKRQDEIFSKGSTSRTLFSPCKESGKCCKQARGLYKW